MRSTLLAVTLALLGGRATAQERAGASDGSEAVLQEEPTLSPASVAALDAARGALERVEAGADPALALGAALDELAGVPERQARVVLELLVELDRRATALGLLREQLRARAWMVEGLERRLPEQHASLLMAKTRLAGTRYELGDLAGSLALEEQVLAVRERHEAEDSELLLGARANLAVTARDLGRYERARELEETVLAARLRTRPEGDVTVLHARLNLARTLYESGDLDGARSLEEAALLAAAGSLPDDHPEVLRGRQNLAATLMVQGRLEEARQLWTEVLETRLATQGADAPEVLALRTNLALVLAKMGQRREALAQHRAVLAAHQRHLPADHPAVLGAKVDVANTLVGLGDHDAARRLLTEGLEGYLRTFPPDHSLVLSTRLNLSVALHAAGRYEEAREHQEAALAVYEATLPPDHPALLVVRENLALALLDLGEPARAHELLTAVVAGFEARGGPDHPDVLRARTNLASAMKDLGDLEGARALQEVVLEGFERTRDERDLLLHRARSNLASTLVQLGEVEAARPLLEGAVRAFAELLPAGHPDRLRARLNLAVADEELGRGAAYRELVAAFGQVLPPGHPDLTAAQANLGRALRDAGDLDTAQEVWRALATERRALLPPDNADRLAAELELALLGRLRGDEEQTARALAALRDGELARLEGALVAAPRQARAMASRAGGRLDPFLSLSDPASPATAADLFRLFETRRHLATVAVSRRAAAGPDVRELRLDAAATGRRLGRLVQAAPGEGTTAEGWRSAVLAASRERDQAHAAVLRALDARGGLVRRVDPETLAAQLPADGAAVGYHVVTPWRLEPGDRADSLAPPRVLALVLLGDGRVTALDLGLQAELEPLIRGWREALGAPVRRGVPPQAAGASEERAGARLRRWLLDPVLEAAGAPQTLHVALDGLLHLLPLDALPLDSGDRVGDRVRIRTELSFARLLAEGEAGGDAAGMLVVGDVDFDAEPGAASAAVHPAAGALRGWAPRWERLFGTVGEVEALTVLFRERFDGAEAEVLTRGAATAVALRDAVPGRRFVHVATHGWFAPESIPSLEGGPTAVPTGADLDRTVRGFAPLALCGLTLAGANTAGRGEALLTAEELSGFDLSACELAVLSACETNVGVHRAGEGLLSLQTALQVAGARTTVTSLWKVDDALTQRLMRAFYTNLWVEGLGPAEALWAAKVALREEGFPVSAWAGWVLAGDPG